MKKTPEIIFALIVCVSLLFTCSCGSGEAEGGMKNISRPDEDGYPSEISYKDITAKEVLATLPDIDYGGYNIVVLSSKKGIFGFDSESETISDTVSPAVKERNELIEKKYNVNISEIYSEESVILRELANADNSASHYCDYVCLSNGGMVGAAANGLLLNLFSLPYFDWDAGYLNSGLIEKTTAKNQIYALYESVSQYYDNTVCILANTDLISEKDLYSVVKSGAWDIETLISLSEEAAKDVMEKRSPDNSLDVFGLAFLMEEDAAQHSLFVSTGLSLFGSTYHNELQYSVDVELYDGILDIIRDVFGNKSVMNGTLTEIDSAFRGGRLAFLVCEAYYAETLSDCSVNWTLVPIPKIYEGQADYYTCFTSNAIGISVPNAHNDTEMLGNILNGICAASSALIKNAVVENYITFSLRDNQSALLIDKIFDSVTSDISIIYSDYSSRLASLTRDTILEAIETDKSLEYFINKSEADVREMNAVEFK